jgi:hypothetical protein
MGRSAFDQPSYEEGSGSNDWLNFLGPIASIFLGGPQGIMQGLGGLGDAVQTSQQNQINAGRMGAYGQDFERLSGEFRDAVGGGNAYNVQGPGDLYVGGDASQGPVDYYTNDHRISQWEAILADPSSSQTDKNFAQYAIDTTDRGLPVYGDLPTINLGINPAQAGADVWGAFSQNHDLLGRAQSLADYDASGAIDRAMSGPFGMEGIMTQVQDLLGGLPDRIGAGLEGIRNDVGGILQGGHVDSDALAQRIMALYPTEGIDASADIAQLGLLAGKLDKQARQAGSASGGRGPASAAELEAAAYEYAPQLAAQGLQAERMADQFNIGLKQTAAQAGAGGMTLAEQINAGLTGQQADLVAKLGIAGIGTESTAAQALAQTLAGMSQGRAGIITSMDLAQQDQQRAGLEQLVRLGSIDASTAERAAQGDLEAQQRIQQVMDQMASGEAAGVANEQQLLQFMMGAEMNPGALGSQTLLASDFMKQRWPGAFGLKPEEPEEPSAWDTLLGTSAAGAGTAGSYALMNAMMPGAGAAAGYTTAPLFTGW